MKQHHLSTKFLRFYIGIGILGFFLVTLVGSYLVEKHYEHFLSSTLYKEGYNIASSDQVKASILKISAIFGQSYLQLQLFRMQ